MISDPAPTPCLYLVSCEFAPIDDLPAWNDWYEQIHIPDMLSVPGIQAVRRYQRLGTRAHYLAVYEIDSPKVFDEPRYGEVRGWGPWADHIVSWSRELLRREVLV